MKDTAVTRLPAYEFSKLNGVYATQILCLANFSKFMGRRLVAHLRSTDGDASADPIVQDSTWGIIALPE